MILCASFAVIDHALLLGRRVTSRPIVGLARGRSVLRLGLASGLHVYVGNTVTIFVVLRDTLVVVVVGELCDDVPCVQETWDEAKNAEKNVDEGIGRADAALDPDCRMNVSIW